MVFLWSVFGCCGLSSSQQPKPKPLQLKFVDVHGDGIEGVEATFSSLVYQGNSGLSRSGKNLKTVDGGELISGTDGGLTIAVPNAGLGDLSRFHLNAKQAAFAEFTDWASVNNEGVTEIVLSRGIRIAATAVDAVSGEPLRSNLFAIAEQKDLKRLVDWKLTKKGVLLSRPLRDADKRIRLVTIEDGEAVQFSDVIDVEHGEGERKLLRDVPMKNAIELSGRLDDRVPRPVHNGKVSVCVAWPTPSELEEANCAGHWFAHAAIAEDGTFVVTGLPTGDTVQIIAHCDGWFNQRAAIATREAAFPGMSRLLNDGTPSFQLNARLNRLWLI